MEVRLRRYDVYPIMGASGPYLPTKMLPGGQFYMTDDVDPILEAKDERIAELEEVLLNLVADIDLQIDQGLGQGGDRLEAARALLSKAGMGE